MSNDANDEVVEPGRDTAVMYTQQSGKLVLRRFKLRVDGPGGKQEHIHERGTMLAGAHPDNDIVVNDRAVSRYHLELILVEDGLRVRDRGSKNGSFVNGKKAVDQVIHDGDEVSIGGTTIKVNAVDEPMHVRPSTSRRFGEMVGASSSMRLLFSMIEKVAESDVPVIIEGEPGSGKELVARVIHEQSPRSQGPFVAVDCTSIASELVESEIFGHEKGSFTGSSAGRPGAFEIADGGTMLLNYIGELSNDLQAKVLKAIETKEVKRLGDAKVREVDLRIMASTSSDLEGGGFSSELRTRLSVVKLRVPPLRDRKEDIPLLVDAFLKRLGRDPGTLSSKLRTKLMAHRWPGNIEELRDVVERMAALAGGGRRRIDPDMVATTISAQGARWRGMTFKDSKAEVVEIFEREYLADLLRRHTGNISAAAREAKIDRNYIHRLVKKYHLDVPR